MTITTTITPPSQPRTTGDETAVDNAHQLPVSATTVEEMAAMVHQVHELMLDRPDGSKPARPLPKTCPWS